MSYLPMHEESALADPRCVPAFTANTAFKFAVNCDGQNKNWDWKALSGKFRDRTGTLDDVMHHIKQGHALCAGLLGGKWRSKANVIGSNWILLDIDNTAILQDNDGNPLDENHHPIRVGRQFVDVNGNPIAKSDGRTAKKILRHQITLEEAIAHPFVSRYCCLIYTTASHRPDWHKFRLIFRLPETITDIDRYEGMVRLLMEQLPHDPACKDASRVFYGATAAEFPLVNPAVTLPVEWVERAIAFAEQEKLERAEQEKLRSLKRKEFLHQAEEEGWNTDALIQQALSYIPPRQVGSGNYDECRAVLMALADHYGAAEAATVAEQWSPSQKKNGWDITQKLKSFKRSGVTIGSLFHIAKQYGFQFPEHKNREVGKPDQAEYDRVVAQQQEQERLEAEQERETTVNRFMQRLQKWLVPKQPKPQLATSLPSEEFQPYIPGKLPRYTASYQLAFEFEAGQRADFYREAIEKGWGHVLDVSPTGTAKSTTAGQLKPGDFTWTDSDGERVGAERIFYLDSNHRNPSVLEIEQNFADLPVRHTGLAIDPSRTTAGGKPHTRHAKDGEELERTPGNCYRAPLFVAAKQRGLHWAEAEAEQNPICGQCPHFHTCGKPTSIGLSGQGYRAARRQALQQPLIRLSPDSTPPEGFENRVNIWEEATALFQPAESRTATITDFNSQWAALEAGDKDLFDRLFQVRQKLRQLLGSQERWGHDLDRIRQELGEIPDWLNDQVIDGIEEAITPTVQEVLGESHRRLKAWIERCSQRFTDLQRKLKEAQGQIDQHEYQFGGFKDFRLGDDDAIRELRQQAEQLRLQVEECKSEIAEATRQLTEAEHNRSKRQEHRVQAEQALLDTETQWLPDFLRIWTGLRLGSVRIAQGKLILTQRNDRHLNQIQGKRNIYLDSSAHRNILAAHLGTAPEALLVCRQKSTAIANIRRIQIVGFGLAGKQRAETTDQRIAATIEAILLQHNLTRDDALIIDHRSKREATGANLHHFGGRGTNEFKEKKILINIGSPIENIGAAQDRYRVLENPSISFGQYLASFTEAEQMQEEGRLRANLRPEQNLIAVYIGDHALPFSDVEVVQAIDVVSAAANRTQAARRRITTAICEVLNNGIKLTQQAIAAAAKCYQSWISQFFAKYGGWIKWRKNISELLKTTNNTTDISPEVLESLLPEEAEMIAWLEATVPDMVDQPQELLPDVGIWLSCQETNPDFSFDRVLAALSLPVRKAIVAALVLAALPNLDPGGQLSPN